jgi:hypothetical protein
MTLSIMTFGIQTLRKMTLSIITFSIWTLSKMTLSIMTFSIAFYKERHSARQDSALWQIVFMLSVIYVNCRKISLDVKCHYPECLYADCRGAHPCFTAQAHWWETQPNKIELLPSSLLGAKNLCQSAPRAKWYKAFLFCNFLMFILN